METTKMTYQIRCLSTTMLVLKFHIWLFLNGYHTKSPSCFYQIRAKFNFFPTNYFPAEAQGGLHLIGIYWDISVLHVVLYAFSWETLLCQPKHEPFFICFGQLFKTTKNETLLQQWLTLKRLTMGFATVVNFKTTHNGICNSCQL